ncbi:polysaccharide biosynthesis protein [Caenispirillum salinarum]|nr:nucleoside-diphosphate sugar epimerase/dehydratase [Caenispirillum salinarum]
MAAGSFVIALYLRLDDDFWEYLTPQDLAVSTAIFAMIAAPVYWSQGMYRSVWRYASLRDLFAIFRAVTLTLLIFLAVMFLLTRLESVPRSTLVINWFVQLFMLGAPRFLYRLLKDGSIGMFLERNQRKPVLLIGAGDGADQFIRAMQRRDADYWPVGIVALRDGRIGRDIRGVRVLGSIGDLERVVSDLERRNERPVKAVVTPDFMQRYNIKELFNECETIDLPLARLPQLTDFKSGSRVELQPIAIEDLLGRAQASLDRESMRRMVEGRRVFITGAGGSIGSELVRQVASFNPSKLVMVENSEFALYNIDMEISQTHPTMQREASLGDVRDMARITGLMMKHRPQIVFHAAALKHVPMVEHNPIEGMRTNISGTRVVADACVEAAVDMMVLISTDKAVNPTNIMGATKRVAERYCQAMDLQQSLTPNGGTQFVTVRFGNVLGSTGSVVPLFRRQLEAGGPLTVTHPDMTRYFMTIREAVELVLQASAYALGQQQYRGRIFVLDMGNPVKIVDLARQMIRLSGLTPEVDIGITFTGLRPGEKLFEEIFHGEEPPLPTPLAGILLAQTRASNLAELTRMVQDLERSCCRNEPVAAVQQLRALVPEYQPLAGAA